MLDFLRRMCLEDKDNLVEKVEGLVEDTDTDALSRYAKTKQNSEKLASLVINYLIDNFNYHTEEKHSDGRYEELTDMAGPTTTIVQMPRVGNKELESFFADDNDWQ